MKTIKVKIQGIELEAPLLNPEVAKKYEEGYDCAIDRINNAQKIEVGSEGLLEQCNAILDYVDAVFGKGSSKKVFGEQTDLLTCLDALEELTSLYQDQVNPYIRECTSKIKVKSVKADVDADA